MSGTTWRLYGSAPNPADFRTERSARRRARKYRRLGIRATITGLTPEGLEVMTVRAKAAAELDALMNSIVVIVSAAVIFGHGCTSAVPASHRPHQHQAAHAVHGEDG